MNMKATGLTIGLAAVALLALGSEARSQTTLKQSAQRAIDGQPRLAVLRDNRQAIDQEYSRAWSLWYPQVDFRGEVGPEWSQNSSTNERGLLLARRGVGLTVQQRIFDGFEADSEITRQKKRSESAAMRVRETAEVLSLDAVQAHIDVYRQQALLELARKNIAFHEDILRRVRQRIARGVGTQADVNQVQARLDSAFATESETQGQLGEAIARYINIVGNEPDRLVPAESPSVPSAVDDLVNAARKENRTVAITEKDIEVADAEVNAADAPFYPKLSLELGATRQFSQDGVRGPDHDFTALLVLRYNLYKGGGDVAQKSVQLGRLSQAKSSMAVAVRAAEEEARRSNSLLLANIKRVEQLGSAVEQSRQVLDAYTKQFFEAGTRSLLDLLDAENELYVSQSRLVNAEQTRIFAAYRLLSTMGRLVPTLALALPQEADPGQRPPKPPDRP